MKKFFLSALVLFLTLAANAVPARQGQWQTITTEGGATVRVQLVGDEFMHYMLAEDGTRYVYNEQAGCYVKLTDEAAAQRQRQAVARRVNTEGTQQRAAQRRAAGNGAFSGKKKAIVFLAEFANKGFQTENTPELYKQMINGENYTSDEAIGSVRDYFRDQSNGAIDIEFDVVGPVPLAKNVSYYGSNDYYGNDQHVGTMVVECIQWAHSQGVDFSQYDWDGDGAVDEVFVLYAGKGEADGGSKNTIWPHKYNLKYSDYGKSYKIDGVTIDTYACSCELNGSGTNNGLGTFCHEFSHCMGFPDIYDTSYSTLGGTIWFGMGYYDLMDQGCYNGSGWLPAGYSAYEKSVCGWNTVHDMTDISEKVVVDGIKPASEHGDAYIIKNQAFNNEYFMVEYRKKDRWDSAMPSEGIMVTYVDYNKSLWDNNSPNTRQANYYEDGVAKTNDHQHLTLFHANNATSGNAAYYNAFYPYNGNNSLTQDTKPASKLYHANADGTKYMHVDLLDMKVADDRSTASVTFAPVGGDTPVDPSGQVAFYESFNKCSGQGGNDGLWNSITSNVWAAYDNEGWTTTSVTIKAADRCVRLGAVSNPGNCTSPEFSVNGKATLTFKAGAWDSDNDGTELTLSASNGTLDNTSFTMTKGDWQTFTATLVADGNVQLTFQTDKGRFFLDEVKVVKDSATGICLTGKQVDNRVIGYYSLDGTRLSQPKKGVNIVRYADGTTRKVVQM